MLIQGTIQTVNPPDFADRYNNQYQNITINTATGLVTGRIGSKQPYGAADIGQQGQWDMEQAQSQKGPYNKLKRHYDTPYQGQQGPQQAAQGTKPPQRQNNSRELSIERQVSFKAACEYAGRIGIDGETLIKIAIAGHYFIETGENAYLKDHLPPSGNTPPEQFNKTPDPSIVTYDEQYNEQGEQIPF